MPEPAQATRRWAIDTSVVLGALKHKDGHCSHLLATIDHTPEIEVVASTLLIAECIDITDDEQARHDLDVLLASTTITWVPVTRAIALHARQLGRSYQGLKGADAAHLACAIAANAEAFFVRDGDFNAVLRTTIGSTEVLAAGEYPGQQILHTGPP